MNPHYFIQRRWIDKNPEKAAEIARKSTAKWQAKQRMFSRKQLIPCHICGKKLFVINGKHLKKHTTTIKDYRTIFPDAITHSPDTIDEHRKHKYANLYSPIYLSNKTKSVLAGTLLGDGSLELSKKSPYGNARYKETAANERYLEWKKDIISEAFEMRFKVDDYRSTQTGKIYH